MNSELILQYKQIGMTLEQIKQEIQTRTYPNGSDFEVDTENVDIISQTDNNRSFLDSEKGADGSPKNSSDLDIIAKVADGTENAIIQAEESENSLDEEKSCHETPLSSTPNGTPDLEITTGGPQETAGRNLNRLRTIT